jgi:hypothetical protein
MSAYVVACVQEAASVATSFALPTRRLTDFRGRWTLLMLSKVRNALPTSLFRNSASDIKP